MKIGEKRRCPKCNGMTPELQALSEAPDITLKRIGSDAERLLGRVRDMLCNSVQR
jgi:hypothetical protein